MIEPAGTAPPGPTHSAPPSFPSSAPADVALAAPARIRHLFPALVAVLLWFALYIPAAGHGFIKDDFVWIAESRLDDGEWAKLLGAPTGFFRPIVSATFALNHAAVGLDPFWYGQTNVLLAAACMAAVFYLARGLRIGAAAAAFAALLWGFNFHGVNLAVLWISGRTALVSTLAVTLAAGAWVRGRRWIALVCATTAMLAKEEALVGPALLTAWTVLETSGTARVRARAGMGRSWPLWAAAAACLVLRARSGAFTPMSAPDLYRYQYDVDLFLANGLHYLERSGLTAALGLGALWMLAGRPRIVHEPAHARVMAFGALWWAFALVPTVLLPVRSSLYALLPAVGIALIASVGAEGALGMSADAVRRRIAIGLLVVLVALSPVYVLRNRRLVRESDLSSAIVAELQRLPAASGVVVLYDDRAGRPFAEHAFGGLARVASRLVSNGRLDLWISPRPSDIGPEEPEPDASRVIAELALSNGLVQRVR